MVKMLRIHEVLNPRFASENRSMWSSPDKLKTTIDPPFVWKDPS
jgi:hypothetical protein